MEKGKVYVQIFVLLTHLLYVMFTTVLAAHTCYLDGGRETQDIVHTRWT